MEDLLDTPVKVKLLTLWMIDKEYETKDVNKHSISHGVWETISVFIKEGKRAYQLKCVWPAHKDLKTGETRKMYEDVLLELCHQVKIVDLPKKIKPI